MGLPHQQPVTQPVITVALRLASGGWNESVHPGGSDLLQKQQRRGRAICLIVELDTSGKTLARLLSRLLSLHTWSKVYQLVGGTAVTYDIRYLQITCINPVYISSTKVILATVDTPLKLLEKSGQILYMPT